jgi:hypothetical protein
VRCGCRKGLGEDTHVFEASGHVGPGRRRVAQVLVRSRWLAGSSDRSSSLAHLESSGELYKYMRATNLPSCRLTPVSQARRGNGFCTHVQPNARRSACLGSQLCVRATCSNGAQIFTSGQLMMIPMHKCKRCGGLLR